MHCCWHCSCRTYFCCFPLAHAKIRPWPLVPFFQISLKKNALKTTHNTFWDRCGRRGKVRIRSEVQNYNTDYHTTFLNSVSLPSKYHNGSYLWGSRLISRAEKDPTTGSTSPWKQKDGGEGGWFRRYSRVKKRQSQTKIVGTLPSDALFHFWPVSPSSQCWLSQLTHQICTTTLGGQDNFDWDSYLPDSPYLRTGATLTKTDKMIQGITRAEIKMQK